MFQKFFFILFIAFAIQCTFINAQTTTTSSTSSSTVAPTTSSPTTSSTVAPTTSSTVAATSSTVAPTTSSTVAPTTSSTVAPTTSSTEATTSSTVAPTTSSTVAPTTSSTVAATSSTVAPTTSSTVAATTSSTVAATSSTVAATTSSTVAATTSSVGTTSAGATSSTVAQTTSSVATGTQTSSTVASTTGTPETTSEGTTEEDPTTTCFVRPRAPTRFAISSVISLSLDVSVSFDFDDFLDTFATELNGLFNPSSGTASTCAYKTTSSKRVVTAYTAVVIVNVVDMIASEAAAISTAISNAFSANVESALVTTSAAKGAQYTASSATVGGVVSTQPVVIYPNNNPGVVTVTFQLNGVPALSAAQITELKYSLADYIRKLAGVYNEANIEVTFTLNSGVATVSIVVSNLLDYTNAQSASEAITQAKLTAWVNSEALLTGATLTTATFDSEITGVSAPGTTDDGLDFYVYVIIIVGCVVVVGIIVLVLVLVFTGQSASGGSGGSAKPKKRPTSRVQLSGDVDESSISPFSTDQYETGSESYTGSSTGTETGGSQTVTTTQTGSGSYTGTSDYSSFSDTSS